MGKYSENINLRSKIFIPGIHDMVDLLKYYFPGSCYSSRSANSKILDIVNLLPSV